MANIINLPATQENILKYKDTLVWGSYGKKGNLPLRKVLLKDRPINHLKSILRTQNHITNLYRVCIMVLIEEKYEIIKKRIKQHYEREQN